MTGGKASERLRTKTIALSIVIAIGTGLTSCRQSPAERRQTAEQTIEHVRAELRRSDPVLSVQEQTELRERAEKALATLERLSQDDPTNRPLAVALQRAAEAIRDIRHQAGIAREQQQRQKILGSLKVRAYLAIRGASTSACWRSLAYSARQAQAGRLGELPEMLQMNAELAVRLWDIYTEAENGPAVGPLEEPSARTMSAADWERVATTLEGWAEHEPAEVALFVAGSYLAAGQTDLALAEIERLDPAQLRRADTRPLVEFVRAMIYQRAGFTELGADTLAALDGDTEAFAQLQALVHCLLAYDLGTKNKWLEADRELACAVRVWPGDPLVAFLAGESQISHGQKEQAVATLERAQTMSDSDSRVAKLLARRIREVRESSGPPPPFVMEPRLLMGIAVETLRLHAAANPTLQRFVRFFDTTCRLDPAGAEIAK